jgi:molybdopterin-guanine dinucleotide biosynthesis protein B
LLEFMKGRIVAVAGWKGTGKTTVVEALIRSLKTRGLTVGTVKDVHDGMELQPEARDSARHLGAGAEIAIALAEGAAIFMRPGDAGLESLLRRYGPLCDVIVAEGFKHEDIPKVVVTESEEVPGELGNVVAVVSRGRAPRGYPAFGADDVESLVDHLFKEGVLRPAGAMTALLVDGRPVPINEFVGNSLAGMVRGFVGALRDTENPSTIEVVLRIQGPRKM